MTSKGIAQTNQQQNSEKSQASGTLQRAAVRSVSDAQMQSTEDKEAKPLSNSVFSKDFSRVPISTTKPQQIMAKLMIGEPGDKYEREADAMANKVMSMSTFAQLEMGTPEQTHSQVHSQPLAAEITPLVQHKAIQLSTHTLQGAGEFESLLSRTKGGGSPLPDKVQAFMEPRFGAKLSDVRVHTSSEAVQMNHTLGSQAFAYGKNIYYGAGKSPRKDHLTAHEVAHTFQQSGSTVHQTGKRLLIQGKKVILEAECEKHSKSADKVPVDNGETYFAGFTMPVKVKEDGGGKVSTLINDRYFIRQYAGDEYESIDEAGKSEKIKRRMADDGYGAEQNKKGDQIENNNEISWEDTPGWTSEEVSLTSPQHIKNYVFKVQWVVSKINNKKEKYLSSEQEIKMNTEEANTQGEKVINYTSFDKVNVSVEVPDEVAPGTRRSGRLKGESANQYL